MSFRAPPGATSFGGISLSPSDAAPNGAGKVPRPISSHGLEGVKKSRQLTQRRQGAKRRKAELLSFLCAFQGLASLRECFSSPSELFHTFLRRGPQDVAANAAWSLRSRLG